MDTEELKAIAEGRRVIRHQDGVTVAAELIAARAKLAAAERLAEAARRLILNLDEGDFISTSRIDAVKDEIAAWEASK